MSNRWPFLAAASAAIAAFMSLSTARAQSAPGSAVYVDLQSSGAGVRIDQVLGDGTTHAICSAPCRRPLSRGWLYVIQGDGVPATTPFRLPEDRQDVTLAVRPGSKTRTRVGLTLVSVGLVAMAVGFVTAPHPTTPDSSRSPASPWPALIGVAGLAFAGVGAYLWWSGDTRVSSSTGRTFSAVPPAARKRPAIALTWRGLEF